MTKINHSRPELVFRDNLARELGKHFQSSKEQTDSTWPSALIALGGSEKAKIAIVNLIECLEEIFDKDDNSMKTQEFQSSVEQFLASRAYDPYDNQLTIESWLANADPEAQPLIEILNKLVGFSRSGEWSD